jgi:GntP family gluconate:H+ symporter
MAIGGGSMVVSHANDSYFWVVSQFSEISMRDAYKSFSIITLLQGVTVLVSVILIYLVYNLL